MSSFNDSFQERLNRANQAKSAALDKLRAKPPVDEAVLAERRAAQEAREAEKLRLAAERRAAREEEKAAKKAAAEERAAAGKVPEKTEAEKKAERDARYAARKARKG